MGSFHFFQPLKKKFRYEKKGSVEILNRCASISWLIGLSIKQIFCVKILQDKWHGIKCYALQEKFLQKNSAQGLTSFVHAETETILFLKERD